MKEIYEKEESSVHLLTIEVSEDEVAVLSGSLNHFLAHSDDETVDRVCGAYRDEVEGIRDDLAQLLKNGDLIRFPIPRGVKPPIKLNKQSPSG